MCVMFLMLFFFFQAEDGIRDLYVTGVQTCALPILNRMPRPRTNRSFSVGTIRITSAPRIGIMVVIVMAEFCQVIEPSLSSLRQDALMKTMVSAITPTNSPAAYHCTLPD